MIHSFIHSLVIPLYEFTSNRYWIASIIPLTLFQSFMNHSLSFISHSNPSNPIPIQQQSVFLCNLARSESTIHSISPLIQQTHTSNKLYTFPFSLHRKLLRVAILVIFLSFTLDKHVDDRHDRRNDKHNKYHHHCNHRSGQPRHSHIEFRRALAIGLHVA